MHQVIWRQHKAQSTVGGMVFLAKPFLPHGSGELLLQQILAMPREGLKPVGYDEACDAFLTAYCQRPKPSLDSMTASQWAWKEYQRETVRFCNGFVSWVTRQGYFIELTHEEYRSTGRMQ